jgi:hypothetical protein
MATTTVTSTTTGTPNASLVSTEPSNNLVTVSTYLNYVRELDIEKPPADWNDLEKKNAWHDEQANPDLDPTPVTITDIRGREEHFTLNKQGFEVFHLDQEIKYDFSSNEGVKRTWLPAVETILKQAIEANLVIPFDHHIRRFSLSKALTMHREPYADTPKMFIGDNGFDILGPARRVHVDGDISGAQMQELLTPEQLAEYSNCPYAVVNVWHPLKTVRKDPLAVLDTRTLRREDVMRDAFMIFGHEEKDVIENVGIKKPADPDRHQWHFVKDLTPQEALLFKIIDKRKGQENFLGVAHSSFVDPETEGFEEDRESIEVRSLCFF